jgi:putative redox protein
MATATIDYQGELRCVCTHLQSGSIIETDAPTDNFGKGERFSPTDTICIGLATCIITTMGIKAKSEKIDLNGTSLEVTKVMRSDPRRISAIEINLRMKSNPALTAEQKSWLENIGNNCPVMLSLHPDIEKRVRYSWE